MLSCSNEKQSITIEQPQISTKLLTPTKELFYQNGKIKKAKQLKSIYTPFALDSLNMPIVDATMIEALLHQKQLLEQLNIPNNQKISGINVTKEKLEQTVDMLLSWQYAKPTLQGQLQAHQLWGEDKKGNSKFTGYYTPVIRVDRNKNTRYPYPIYERPKDWEGRLPSRKQIDQENVLAPLNLEIAYAQSKVDIYFMQLQGSGIVEYPNGALSYFAYDGTNQHSFRSIGAYLARNNEYNIRDISVSGIKRFFRQHPKLVDSVLEINPSYTFFQPKDVAPQGAGGVPLTAFYSVAVDKRYIPLGSVLLAAMPIKDENNKVIRHEFHFLLAQDVGGSIRGTGHLDLYTGIGKNAQKAATDLYHYGKVWLLLPENIATNAKNTNLAINNL
jgi:membrane-bound lytic murein transglycosylase A